MRFKICLRLWNHPEWHRPITMSRAFVKETDLEEVVPHRPISSHPNLVTAEGLALIERHLTSAIAAATIRRLRGLPGNVGADRCSARNDGRGPVWKHRPYCPKMALIPHLWRARWWEKGRATWRVKHNSGPLVSAAGALKGRCGSPLALMQSQGRACSE